MQRPFEFETVVDAVLAAIGALLAAALTLVVFVFVVSELVALVLYKVGFLTHEGAVWFGIEFGIPVGTIFSVLMAVYCFRKIFKSGES